MRDVGLSWNEGTPNMDNLQRKIPSTNGRFGGTIIFGYFRTPPYQRMKCNASSQPSGETRFGEQEMNCTAARIHT